MTDTFSYRTMTRAQLIQHCEAYSEALHDLAGHAMRAEATIRALQLRLKISERVKGV